MHSLHQSVTYLTVKWRRSHFGVKVFSSSWLVDVMWSCQIIQRRYASASRSYKCLGNSSAFIKSKVDCIHSLTGQWSELMNNSMRTITAFSFIRSQPSITFIWRHFLCYHTVSNDQKQYHLIYQQFCFATNEMFFTQKFNQLQSTLKNLMIKQRTKGNKRSSCRQDHILLEVQKKVPSH